MMPWTRVIPIHMTKLISKAFIEFHKYIPIIFHHLIGCLDWRANKRVLAQFLDFPSHLNYYQIKYREEEQESSEVVFVKKIWVRNDIRKMHIYLSQTRIRWEFDETDSCIFFFPFVLHNFLIRDCLVLYCIEWLGAASSPWLPLHSLDLYHSCHKSNL